jgi:hypothetical protein
VLSDKRRQYQVFLTLFEILKDDKSLTQFRARNENENGLDDRCGTREAMGNNDKTGAAPVRRRQSSRRTEARQPMVIPKETPKPIGGRTKAVRLKKEVE